MNAIIRTVWVPVLIVSLTALANQSIYANKITVTGYPVILDDRNGIFYVPNSYITSTDNNFVSLDGIKSVCYIYEQPKLSVLDRETIKVNINGSILQWVCYRYDENYFAFSH